MPNIPNTENALKVATEYAAIFIDITNKLGDVPQDSFNVLYKRLTETMYFMRTIGETKIAEAIQRCINTIVSNYQSR